MDDNMRAFLATVPDSPTRSKLEPYRDLIRHLRQKRKTYRQIAQMLAINFGIPVDHTTIVKFVKVRANSQRRIPLQLPDTETNTAPPSSKPAMQPPPGSPPPPRTVNPQLYAQMQEIKRQALQKRTNPNTNDELFDESKPLTLITKKD